MCDYPAALNVCTALYNFVPSSVLIGVLCHQTRQDQEQHAYTHGWGHNWQGGQRLYSYFVASSPAVMLTAVTKVAKSHCRQTAIVAEGFPDSR